MEFEKIVHERYAVKKFDGKTVPKDKINKLFEIIRFAASSYNIQPWKIVIVTDNATREKLQKASWNQAQITTCSHLLVFCADKNIKGCIDRLEKLMLKDGSNPDHIKQYVGMMRDFDKGMDDAKKLSWAQRQVYIALCNAINGAKSLGFDSCPMEGFDPKAYSEILKLPENLASSVLCPIVYAADTPKSKIRFSVDDVFEERP